jgi:large subunit ribosomal protein L13
MSFATKAPRRHGELMSTHIPKAGELTRKWYVIDAKDQVLGKLATTAARLLTGKHKPS